MFNSGMLDVVLGLIFLYLLLSLITSAINEIIEARLKMRATDLERGLRELLADKDGTGVVKALYEHPLISGLCLADEYLPCNTATGFRAMVGRLRAGGPNLPSYIPRRNFALALMDIMLPAKDVKGGVSGAAGSTVRPKPASRSWFQQQSTVTPADALRTSIDQITNPAVQRALRVLIDAAGNDAAKARENIENWFDSSMDRVSGWYKRRTQWIVFAIGVVLAVAMNVDTITVATTLSLDTAMRNSLVSAAQQYAKETPPKDSETDVTPEARVKKDLDLIKGLGLPIGWSQATWGRFVSSWSAALSQLGGWLLTGMAVSLGAPFWFDMLNKVITVRSTVKPAEKSPDEPPTDRP